MPRKPKQARPQDNPTTQPGVKPKRKPGRPRKPDPPLIKLDENSNNIDLSKALSLRFHNRLSYGDIAKSMGVTKQAVHKAITKFMAHIDEPEAVESFKSARADLLTAAQLTVLRSVVDPTKLEKASTNNAAYALRQLFDMERLERGESTSNIAYHNIDGKISDLDNKEAELRRQLGDVPEAEILPEGEAE